MKAKSFPPMCLNVSHSTHKLSVPSFPSRGTNQMSQFWGSIQLQMLVEASRSSATQPRMVASAHLAVSQTTRLVDDPFSQLRNDGVSHLHWLIKKQKKSGLKMKQKRAEERTLGQTDVSKLLCSIAGDGPVHKVAAAYRHPRASLHHPEVDAWHRHLTLSRRTGRRRPWIPVVCVKLNGRRQRTILPSLPAVSLCVTEAAKTIDVLVYSYVCITLNRKITSFGGFFVCLFLPCYSHNKIQSGVLGS